MVGMTALIRRGRVIGRAPLSPRVTEISLEIEGDEPFRWIAGQHVVVRPDLPGGAASYFSIAAAPNQAGLRRLTLASRNDSELLARAPFGAFVTIEGPFGELTLRQAPAALLVGVGTGVAPLRAIVHAALASDDDGPLVLVSGNRRIVDLLWHDELLALASEHARFVYEPVLSQADPSFSGRRGYVQDHLPALFTGLPDGFRAYLCGSTRMVAECRGVLGKLGVAEERMLSEADS
jgi:CDP-4-dehydro-6-deoxyglucose reductase